MLSLSLIISKVALISDHSRIFLRESLDTRSNSLLYEDFYPILPSILTPSINR